MRHGIPVAGNFLQQELAIITGAVEMMITDVQCCMPSLPEVAGAYHTEIVSTSAIARTVGATHHSFDEDNALESAKSLILRAIDNYRNRDRAKMAIPDHRRRWWPASASRRSSTCSADPSAASFRPLNDAIIQGRIHGVCGIVGCNNPRQDGRLHQHPDPRAAEAQRPGPQDRLRRRRLGQAGDADPRGALSQAGPGLREVCEAVGMPPVLHMGSCVDNSRILEAATEIVEEGGLGDDLSDMPAVGVAPEWMSEKAVAIGCYFVASGIDVVLGHPFHTRAPRT